MSQPSAIGRRRSERVPCRAPLAVTRKGAKIWGSAIDLNRHGLFVVGLGGVRVGELVELEIAVGLETVRLFVVVRSIGRKTCGLGFGAEIHVGEPQELARWVAFYELLLGLRRANDSTS